MKPASHSGDRRRICRYPVVLEDALLGWRQEPSFANTPVRIVNLSAQGCLVEVRRCPRLEVRQSVWIRPHEGSGAGWIEGRIISIQKPLIGKSRVRISFLVPVAYEAFKKLVYGLEQFGALLRPEGPEHEKDHFWK
jgi:hypothetical protein